MTDVGYPHDPRNFKHSDLPEHARLRLVSSSNQPLRDAWARRLVTMEKICTEE